MKKIRVPIVIIAVAFSLWACPSTAPERSPGEMSSFEKELADQRKILEEIRDDLGVLKEAIESGRPPQADSLARPVSIDDDHLRGHPKAKLTLIEFSDFQCPYCERFYRETLPQIDREYIQTGKLRMVYRDFPIEEIHPNAKKAAEAAQCAGEQGKFWEMHDRIFENPRALAESQLKTYARGLGLSGQRFDQCLDSGKYAEEVAKDFLDGQKVGVQGTPTFFLGYSGQGGTIEAKPIRGAQPFIVFKQAIDKMLEEQKAGP